MILTGQLHSNITATLQILLYCYNWNSMDSPWSEGAIYTGCVVPKKSAIFKIVGWCPRLLSRYWTSLLQVAWHFQSPSCRASIGLYVLMFNLKRKRRKKSSQVLNFQTLDRKVVLNQTAPCKCLLMTLAHAGSCDSIAAQARPWWQVQVTLEKFIVCCL